MQWVLVSECRLSLVAVGGVYSLLAMLGLHCCRAWGLGCAGFSSCSTRAYLPHSMWDLLGPGIEPVSSALAGGFLTTGLPGKPPIW